MQSRTGRCDDAFIASCMLSSWKTMPNVNGGRGGYAQMMDRRMKTRMDARGMGNSKIRENKGAVKMGAE